MICTQMNDSQHSFGVSHLAYLAVWVSGHLPPFAKWTAFPSSDYYGGSVALGLAPGRRSHIPRVSQMFERDVGAPSVSLSRVVPDRPRRGEFRRRRLCRLIPVASPVAAVARNVRLHRWRLGFGQCGSHRIARVLRDAVVSDFG